MVKTKVVIIMVTSLLLVMSCSRMNNQQNDFDLHGAWVLKQEKTPEGYTHSYPQNGTTQCRVYVGDSVYSCNLMYTASGMAIVPLSCSDYTFIDKGNHDYLYFEQTDPHPFAYVNDSTIIIQHSGIRYTWVRSRQMTDSRIEEIRTTIADNLNEGLTRFVLSTTERELRAQNSILVYLIIIMVVIIMFIIYVALDYRRRSRIVERQLQQIKEEHELRPIPVQKAIDEVEMSFFQTDYYVMLRRHLAAGNHLSDAEWEELEQRMRPVYPGFSNKLYNLCNMSEVEYHVCLLLKIHATPSEIANAVIKDLSSVSSIRNRLYKKVFNRNGGAKAWDDFVLSI
ncbi:MAG: hypothetical protein K6E52_11580 [Bacteroidaceae bacterium]|nr:hypothetical protein [Bacteroidaceae bacterium]